MEGQGPDAEGRLCPGCRILGVFPKAFSLQSLGVSIGLEPTERNLPLQVMEGNKVVQGAIQDTQILALDLDYPPSLHLHWAEGLQVVQSHTLRFGGLFQPGSFQ